MLSSILKFTFLFFQQKRLFEDKFCPKNQRRVFKVKLGLQTNSNMLNLMILFSSFFRLFYLHINTTLKIDRHCFPQKNSYSSVLESLSICTPVVTYFLGHINTDLEISTVPFLGLRKLFHPSKCQTMFL